MKGVRSFKTRLKEELKNKNFRKSFNEEDFYVRIAIQIAKLREEQGISQQELARRLHTSQQMVSRLEDTSNKSFTLKTLIKLAQAFHKKLDIEFV